MREKYWVTNMRTGKKVGTAWHNHSFADHSAEIQSSMATKTVFSLSSGEGVLCLYLDGRRFDPNED